MVIYFSNYFSRSWSWLLSPHSMRLRATQLIAPTKDTDTDAVTTVTGGRMTQPERTGNRPEMRCDATGWREERKWTCRADGTFTRCTEPVSKKYIIPFIDRNVCLPHRQIILGPWVVLSSSLQQCNIHPSPRIHFFFFSSCLLSLHYFGGRSLLSIIFSMMYSTSGLLRYVHHASTPCLKSGKGTGGSLACTRQLAFPLPSSPGFFGFLKI